MRYVLDASVAVKWVIPEDDSDRAIALRDSGHEFIAPDVFPVEVAHALVKADRKGFIPLDEASDALEDVLAYAPAFHSSLELLSEAVELASRTRASVYDCLYVTLAEREGCEMITADRKLVNNLSHVAQLRLLSSF